MKTIRTSVILILSSIFVAISFSACSADNDAIEQVPTPSNISTPASNVRVTASGYVRTQVNTKALSRGNANELKAEDFSFTPISEAQAKGFTTGEAGDDGKSIISCYRWVTLNYLCKTVDGTQKELSELVVWPYRAGDCTPSQLVVGCHSTITSNKERPRVLS